MNTCQNAARAPRAPHTALAHGALGASNGSHRRRHLATMAVALGLSLSPLAARAQHDAAEPPVPTAAPAAPTTKAAPVAPPTPTTPATPGRPPLAPSVDVAAVAARAAEQARMDVDTSFASVLMKRERVVKGAPYCAQAMHETVQPLMDGNRIVHKQSSQLCRDGEGRTRQEVDRQGRRLVYLRDPVSGENWLLDPERKTARFLGGRVEVRTEDRTDENARREAERQRDYAERQKDYAERMRDYAERMREWAQERAAALRDRVHAGDTAAGAEAATGNIGESGETKAGPRPQPRPDAQPNPRPVPKPNPVPPPPPPRAVVIAPAIDRQEVRIIQIGTPDGIDTPTPPIPAAVGLSAERLTAVGGKSQVETLPNRELDGLKVSGRRVTNTIEAGKVGNEKPIVITTEVWTSPDLQLTVSSVQKDPRSGEQNYLLKDIRRSEPDATLMKVPADYRRIGVPAAKKG